MTTADKLRKWRKAEGMSQQQAATWLGIATRTWQKWEYGEASPWLKAAVAIQQAGGPAVTEWVKEDA